MSFTYKMIKVCHSSFIQTKKLYLSLMMMMMMMMITVVAMIMVIIMMMTFLCYMS